MNDALQEKASRPVGEVVVASTTEFVTQCHALYEAPPLGSLVRCGGDSPIYGVVGDVTTRSIDPGRRPMALGEDEDTEEAVYQRNPQLNRLLTTEFRSVVVGHRADGRLNRYLAPLPPRIHAFVYAASVDETVTLATSPTVLPVLVAANTDAGDDFIAAGIRTLAASSGDPEAFLVDAGRRLVHILRGESQRLQTLLPKIRPG